MTPLELVSTLGYALSALRRARRFAVRSGFPLGHFDGAVREAEHALSVALRELPGNASDRVR